jgi:hypothetical protein
MTLFAQRAAKRTKIFMVFFFGMRNGYDPGGGRSE